MRPYSNNIPRRRAVYSIGDPAPPLLLGWCLSYSS